MKISTYILLILSLFAFGFAGYKFILAYTHPLKYQEEIIYYANENNLPAELVASIINVESSYKDNAQSNKNALGLMQIKLSTAEYLNDYYSISESITQTDLFNAKTNIKYGCLYLKYLIDKFKNTNTALAAYNAGETRVRAWLSDSQYSSDGITLYNIPYMETDNYVKKINKNLSFYKKYIIRN